MRTNFYKIFIGAGVGLFIFLISNTASAESETIMVKKAVLNVKQSVDTLVVARDENVTDDFALRFDAFKKVINLSISEVKDLRVKLLLNKIEDESLKAWQEKSLKNLDALLLELETQKIEIKNIDNADTIKASAQSFKEWREINYTPIIEEVNNFILIKKVEEGIVVAKAREAKISKDIQKLKRTNPRVASALKNLFLNGDTLIKESEEAKSSAEKLFMKKYVMPITDLVSASGTVELDESFNKITTSTINISSEAEKETGISSSTLKIVKEVTIGDHIKTSLTKIREAYQAFIEMGNLVRELLP